MEDLQGETTYNLLLLYWERITDEKQTRDQFNKCKCKNCFPIPKLKFSYNYYLYKCELFISLSDPKSVLFIGQVSIQT